MGGILQAEHAQLALLRAEPALVPDLGVATALIDRGEDPPHVLWGVPNDIQPGPVTAVRLDVSGGVALRDFGEPTASGVEAGQFFTDMIGLGLRAGNGVRGAVRCGPRCVWCVSVSAHDAVIAYGTLCSRAALISWTELRRRPQLTQLTHGPIIPADGIVTRL